MPLYIFSCQTCKQETEKLLPVKDRDSEVFCPKCNSLTERKPTSATPIFKGTGWTTPVYSGKYDMNDIKGMSEKDLKNAK